MFRCNVCKIEKSLDNYYTTMRGHHHKCKECSKAIRKQKYQDNKDVIKKQVREWEKRNPNKAKQYTAKWQKLNPDKVKKYINKNPKKTNKEYIKNYVLKRLKEDPLYKLAYNLRRRTNEVLKLKRFQKNNKFKQYIGCTPEELKQHLEKQFQEGMSWDNYGVHGWHIDHIKPLSKASTEEELYKRLHYTNLQPLWANENRSKGNKDPVLNNNN